MLNRILTSFAGFFVYMSNLLAYIDVPAQVNKPAVAGGFVAIAVALAGSAIARASFAGWKRVVAGVLVGASLTSIVAVAAIAWVRHSDTLMRTEGAEQLRAFRDYQTGGAVSTALLVCGWTFAWSARRERLQKKQNGA